MSNPNPNVPPPYAPSAVAGYQDYQPAPQPVAYGQPPTYVPSYQGGAPPGYNPVTVQPNQTAYVYTTGNCPACHIGFLQDQFTPLGICLAICFFPIGILCCLMLTDKRCSHCGMSFT